MTAPAAGSRSGTDGRPSWARPDDETDIAGTPEGHGGADVVMIAEFLRFVRTGEPTETSPIAAREAVAAGVIGHRVAPR